MFSTWLGATWGALIVRGVLAVIFGIIAVASPVATAIALALLWGIWALVDGITMITHVFTPSSPTGNRVLWGLMGVLALVAAFIAITRPGLTAVTLTWVLGIWLLVRAVTELVMAFRGSQIAPRGLFVVSALLDGVLGFLFVANPGVGAVSVAWVLGLLAILWGIVFIVLGVMLRKEVRETSAA